MTGKTEYIDILFLHIDWKDSRRLGGINDKQQMMLLCKCCNLL